MPLGGFGLIVLASVGTWMMGDGGEAKSPEAETVADDTIAEPPAHAVETPTKTSDSEVSDAGTHRRSSVGGILGSTSCHILVLLVFALWPVAAMPPGGGRWVIDGGFSEAESVPLEVVVIESTTETFDPEPVDTLVETVFVAPELPALEPPVEPPDFAALESTSASPSTLASPSEPTEPASNNSQKPAVSFLGTEAEAESVVFLVDSSTSMRWAKFQRVVVALQESLRELDSEQSYLVVLFREDPVVMFEPEPATSLLPPTGENRSKTTRWLRRQRPEGLTDPRPALELALALEPQAIFLLTDGELPATVLALADTAKSSGTRIHTLTFDRKPARVLSALAASTGGSHRVAN